MEYAAMSRTRWKVGDELSPAAARVAATPAPLLDASALYASVSVLHRRGAASTIVRAPCAALAASASMHSKIAALIGPFCGLPCVGMFGKEYDVFWVVSTCTWEAQSHRAGGRGVVHNSS